MNLAEYSLKVKQSNFGEEQCIKSCIQHGEIVFKDVFKFCVP